jgi:hypothetical protein
MATWTSSALIEFSTSGTPGMAYISTPTGIQGFTGPTSCGSPSQGVKLDFSPSGLSAGMGFNVILSAGGDLYSIAVGSTVTASYQPIPETSPAGEPVKSTGMANVTETWTRVK